MTPPIAALIAPHSFGRYLAESTGLTSARALDLYRAGYPWPLYSTEDMRQIGLLAQAKGLHVDEALEVRSAPDPDRDETLERLAQYVRVKSPFYDELVTEGSGKSLPCIDKTFDHLIHVVALTREKGSTIWRLFLAIQRWAMAHPQWDPAAEIAPGAGLVC